MSFRLIPRDQSFFPLFEELAALIESTATSLADLVGNLPATDDGVRAILDAERAGDVVTKRVREQLETSIVTPFDREDIQELTNHLDDVLDEMRAVADHLQMHQVHTLIPGVTEQLTLLCQASVANKELVGRLRTMRGVQECAERIERIESEADAMYRRVVAGLFNGQHEALDVLRWQGIVASIESAVDAIEDASDVVHAITVKHA